MFYDMSESDIINVYGQMLNNRKKNEKTADG